MAESVYCVEVCWKMLFVGDCVICVCVVEINTNVEEEEVGTSTKECFSVLVFRSNFYFIKGLDTTTN